VSTATTADDTGERSTTPAPAVRVRPSHVAVGVGIAFALLVVASGVVATVLQWHDDSGVQRVVFINIPSAWKAVF
jgi:hypothetical protein